MGALIFLALTGLGGFCVKLCIESFKDKAYFLTGVMGITSIVLTAILVDWVLYQCFIY